MTDILREEEIKLSKKKFKNLKRKAMISNEKTKHPRGNNKKREDNSSSKGIVKN